MEQLNQKNLPEIIGIDEDNCVNCHACISACPVKFCNDGSGDVVKINSNMCIGCGKCESVCPYNAIELLESTKIIRECLHLMRKGDISIKVPKIVPKGEAVFRVEAPRGELFYYAKSDGTDRPYRIKIRTPTLSNINSLKPMLKGQQLADVPLIVASIDPCFSCRDRVTLIDHKTNETTKIDETYLRTKRR